MIANRNDIATRAAALSLVTIERLAKASDPEEFTRLDKIAQRATYLATACSRMVAPIGGSQQEQEGTESPG